MNTYLIALHDDVVLQDIENTCHLAEDQHAVAALKELDQQLVE